MRARSRAFFSLGGSGGAGDEKGRDWHMSRLGGGGGGLLKGRSSELIPI